MITGKLAQRAQELSERSQPFVTATVVRVQHPTSVEPGSVALVLGDGTIEGFIGGVCAEQSVRLYSLQAIDNGEPVLLRITPDADAGAAESESETDDGAVTVANPCLSGGALEIFLEPLLPAPRVTVAGDSPIAAALRRLGPELGLELRTGSPSAEDLALVVAAHGRDELGALRAGLEAGVPYVGLVASRKRGAAVIDELRGDGVDEQLLAAIETPAGIDIGARTPAEIALAILARIVAVRREQRAPAEQSAPHARTAVDPICGMTVVIGPDTPSAQRDEETVYFCCEGCMKRFAA